MTAIATSSAVTPEDLLHLPDLGRYEALIDGVLQERNVSYLSSNAAYEFNGRIRNHLVETSIGYGFQADCGLEIFPWMPGKVRFADGGFISRERSPRPGRGHLRVAPDLVVEVVSYGDNEQEAEKKRTDYLRAGVRMIWIAYPLTRHVTVWRADGSAVSLGPDAVLSGGDVLPGFACRVGDLFLEVDQEDDAEDGSESE